MPTYRYIGRTSAGEVHSGEIEVPSREDVLAHLRKRRLIPVRISRRFELTVPGPGTRVSQKEVIVFTRQFATLVDAGVPLVQSLTVLADQSSNPELKRVVTEVREDVRAGATLAGALARHPSVFDELYVNMIAAGEAGGILHAILARLATFLEKSGALARRIRGAMAYPAVVLAVVCGATGILLWKVVPIFADIFADAGMALPAPTLLVLGASEFLRRHLLLIVVGIMVAVGATVRFRRTEAGRQTTDRLLLRLPVAGDLARKAAVSRFTRTLGALVSSGVSILDGLEITARTAGNRVIHDAVMGSRRSIAGGTTIAEPLRESGVFPSMVTQMIHVGEETGGLETMLGKIADFYDDEVDAAVASLTSILEPVMIVVMGIVIGGMVVAMYLPMFDLIQTVQ
jgi:type IV pilus assembly protein PilC